MRLQRLGRPGHEIPVLRHRGRALDLRPLTNDIDGAFFATGGLGRVRDATRRGELAELLGADQLRVGAPIARPQAILCIGQNYAAHAAESGAAAPTQVIVFHKHPNTIVGPFDEVRVPPGAQKVDWEVELGVVIGARTRYLASADEALQYVAGYVVSNDVSEREFQMDRSGGQWSKGKNAETFNPLGPELVTTDEIPDPQRLRLRSQVNGEPRQDSSTTDMVFSVAQIIHDLSQYMVLEPGDLINTGTPEGVAFSGRFPYLRGGDAMTLSIEGLGEQRQILIASGRGNSL